MAPTIRWVNTCVSILSPNSSANIYFDGDVFVRGVEIVQINSLHAKSFYTFFKSKLDIALWFNVYGCRT